MRDDNWLAEEFEASRPRLRELLSRHRFVRAIDAVEELEGRGATLPRFTLAA